MHQVFSLHFLRLKIFQGAQLPNHSSMTAGGRSSRMDTAQPTTGRAGKPLCDLAGNLRKSMTTWSWLKALQDKVGIYEVTGAKPSN